MSEAIRGGCLCGAVTFEVRPPFQRWVHCHCSRCRKASGTGHASNFTVDPARFRWLSGEDAIAHYELPTSRRFGKWFCKQCGCPVPRSIAGKVMVVPAGALDSAPPGQPTDRIFWGSRAPWSCDTGGLPTHETLPASW